MFGRRITLAASASLVGVSCLLAQAPPDRNTQGTGLPSQQQPGTPSAAPAAPGTPAAPAGQIGQTIPAAPAQTGPAQSQGEPLPGLAAPVPGARDIPTNPANPVQVPTNAAQPTAQPQNAQPQNAQQTGANAQQAMSDDAKFIVRAAEINLAEINIGRLAAQRASRQDVRQFANQLVQDHQNNLNQLNQMANRNNWRNGERMDQEHQQLFQKLAALQGQQFDNEFIQKMVEGHKKAAEVFKHASENCKNAEIKQYATQTLATVRQHEQEAQRLSGQNQPQATQPTSTDNNNGANRNAPTNRNDENRRDDR